MFASHPGSAILGVCAFLAGRSGLPVLALRIAAVILMFCHPLLIGLAYLAGAWALRSRAQAAPRAPWSDAMDRFDRLNRRAARAEEAAWRQSRY